MELQYIYISEGGHFSPCNINFGGRFLFQYSADLKEISINQNPFYIKDFFNHEDNIKSDRLGKISNISAIVGENGAGKSSVLALLREILCRDSMGIKQDVIVAIADGNKQLLYYSAGLLTAKTLKQYKDKFDFIELVVTESEPNIPNNRLIVQDFPKITAFNEIDFVFFSNIYDHSLESSSPGFRNLSTNFLSQKSEAIDARLEIATSSFSEKDEFRFEEVRRQIDFANKFHYEEVLPFKIPEMILLTVKDDFQVKYTTDEKPDVVDSKAFYYDMSKLFESEINQQTDIRKKIKLYFIGAAFFNYLSETTDLYPVNKDTYLRGFERAGVNEWGFTDLVQHFLTNLAMGGMQSSKRPYYNENTFFASFIEEIPGKLMLFIDNIKRLDIQPHNIGDSEGKSLALYIGEGEEDFFTFYERYRKTYFDRPYLNFSWRDLSSGEKAFFAIYARFFALANENQKEKSWLKQNVIILLDEPDLYLHPAWQKGLVENLRKFLSSNFESDIDGRHRNLQIIFTTNHPLTISDLPHTNIVLLKKIRNKIAVQDSLEEGKRTFAANIFDLYSDSFFLDGFTGIFAVAKINKVFDDLNSPDRISAERLDEIKRIIQMIGEPIVKNKLTEMFGRKEVLFNGYDERINKL